MLQPERMRWHKMYSSVKPDFKLFCTRNLSNYYSGIFPTETNTKSKNIVKVKNLVLQLTQTSLYKFPNNCYCITSAKPMRIYQYIIHVTPSKLVRNIVQIAIFGWPCMIHSRGNNAIVDN